MLLGALRRLLVVMVVGAFVVVLVSSFGWTRLGPFRRLWIRACWFDLVCLARSSYGTALCVPAKRRGRGARKKHKETANKS